MDCGRKADRAYRQCKCPVWFQTNQNGKQHLWSAKTRVWAEAQRKAKEIEDGFKSNGTTPMAPKTIKEAIDLFLNNKQGENLAADSFIPSPTHDSPVS